MAKTIGGTDGMHRKPEKDPFELHTGSGKSTVKFAHSSATHPTAAGDAKSRRANDPSWGGKGKKY